MVFFFTVGTNKMGIKYKGTVEIPNLSDENDMDDLDVNEPLFRIKTLSIQESMLNENLTCVCLYRFLFRSVKTSQAHRWLISWERRESRKSEWHWATMSSISKQVTALKRCLLVISALFYLCSSSRSLTCFTEFSQGMILPTEKALNKQNEETQAKVQLDKTQVSSCKFFW